MLCTECHNIGKCKKQQEYSIRLLLTFLLLICISLFIGLIFPLVFICTFLLLAATIMIISENLKVGDKCPNCDKNSMVPINTKWAQNIIDDKKLSTQHSTQYTPNLIERVHNSKYLKQKICKACLYIGIGKNQEKCNLYQSLLFILGGIITLPLILIQPLTYIGSLILIYAGLDSFSDCFVESKKCPKCKNESMVPLNSYESESILNEKNTNFSIKSADPKPTHLNTPNKLLIISIKYLFLLFIVYRIIVAIYGLNLL